MTAPVFTISEIGLAERDVRLRMPFRFGVVTLTEAPQAFARVRLTFSDGRSAIGMAAELLAPKWFDKNTGLSNEDNFNQLRQSLKLARDHYLLPGIADTAFGHFARNFLPQQQTCATNGLNKLIANYGPALIDRAILDAVCRDSGCSFSEAMQDNLAGMSPDILLPEFRGFDFPAFLASLKPAGSMAARHTVGLVDAITAADIVAGREVNDGLPETLEQVVAHYGHTWFKLKVNGNLEADLARLEAIASVLDRMSVPYHATLDGNEQYKDAEGIIELWHRMGERPRLARMKASIGFIEQPIARSEALNAEMAALTREIPVILDESDDDLSTFGVGRQRGYRGISSKTCKGFYKSIINAARCRMWNAKEGDGRYFMSAEDLTTQAGLSVQQDLALVDLIGLSHVERNGHHYVDGFAGATSKEQNEFLSAHGGLYSSASGRVRLKITNGILDLATLACTGFGSAVHPDWSVMTRYL